MGKSSLLLFHQLDLDYLSANGYILKTTKEDYDKGALDVTRLSLLVTTK